jgi:hypothetical protein
MPPGGMALTSNGLTRSRARQSTLRLSSQAAPLYQAATQQHRQLKAALAKMERLSRTALATLAKKAEDAG